MRRIDTKTARNSRCYVYSGVLFVCSPRCGLVSKGMQFSERHVTGLIDPCFNFNQAGLSGGSPSPRKATFTLRLANLPEPHMPGGTCTQAGHPNSRSSCRILVFITLFPQIAVSINKFSHTTETKIWSNPL